MGHADPFQAADEAWYRSFKVYEAGYDEKYPLEWRHRQFFAMAPPPARGARLLDVGCGTGGFLKAARERGYTVHGLDFEPVRAEFGTKMFGVSIEVGTLQDHLSRGNVESYEVVTCFEVVEHVDDPAGLMRDVALALLPGGTVAVSMPNWNRPFQLADQIGDFPPHHLTWWTADTLRRFLERNGFVDIRIFEEPFDLRRVLFLKLHTGLGRAASALAGAVAGDRAPRARVVAARVARIAKQQLLAVAGPLGRLLGNTLRWKGVGLLALARKPL